MKMKKYIAPIVLALTLLLSSPVSTYAAFPPALVNAGGTGWNSIKSGYIPFGNTTDLRLATSSGLFYSTALSQLQLTNLSFSLATGTAATSTNFAATTICFTGDTCRTTWPSSSSPAGSDGQLQYKSGSSFAAVSTSSPTFNGGLTTSGTAGYIVGGSGFTVTLANINANSVLGNITGSAAQPTSVATSSLFVWNGTGNVVRTTSPALVTPDLGTPSALTLTNATGLPVAGLSNLGTGVGTFLITPSSANLASAITDETGTGLSVFNSSPTIISPIFQSVSGTEWGRLVTGGFFGAGTTTPQWLLQLASSTRSQLTLSDATAGDNHWSFRNAGGWLYIATSSPSTYATSTNTALTIDNNGNLGVSSSTPVSGLSVGNGKAITVDEYNTSTSTSYTIDWRNGNQQLVQKGTAGITLSFSGVYKGGKLNLVVCNPHSGTGGSITFPTSPVILWPGGTAPTQTTTADKCDIYTFLATQGTSTTSGVDKILGGYNTNY